ncbi:hypothetical protein Tco_0379688 [Tanacetum coccineum]
MTGILSRLVGILRRMTEVIVMIISSREEGKALVMVKIWKQGIEAWWCRGDGDDGGGGVRWCWLSGDDGAMMMNMGEVAIVVERRRDGGGGGDRLVGMVMVGWLPWGDDDFVGGRNLAGGSRSDAEKREDVCVWEARWWRWRSAGRDGDGMVAVVGVKIDVVVAGILPDVAGAAPKNGRMYVCGRLDEANGWWCRGDGDEGGGGVRWWCWLSGDDGAMMMKMGVVAIVVERRRDGEGMVASWWWRWRSAGGDGDGRVAVVG